MEKFREQFKEYSREKFKEKFIDLFKGIDHQQTILRLLNEIITPSYLLMYNLWSEFAELLGLYL